jgi:cytochrome c-type biogenesis protein CcsB
VNKFILSIFRFLASTKLAVILLVGFTIILGIATFYESSTSAADAQRIFYKSLWFDSLLYLLGLNVLCSALIRWPWKKQQIGFVITHLGIILILIGSLITRTSGIEGQMALVEGETGDSIIISESVFTVKAPGLKVQQDFDPWFLESPIPDGKEIQYQVDNADINCYITGCLFNPRVIDHITENGPVDNPAIQVTFHQSGHAMPEAHEWLLANSVERSHLNFGAGSIVFKRLQSQEELQSILDSTKASINQFTILLSKSNQLSYVAADSSGAAANHPITLTEIIDTPWPSLKISVDKFYPKAQISQELIDAVPQMGEGHTLPLAQVRLEYQGESQEKHILYNRPETINIAGETIEIEFGQKRVPLGFAIQLVDFQAPRYPGTNRPSRFQSLVRMIDKSKGINEEHLIYMNNPLAYNGFLVYQSSYEEGVNDGPDTSIFSIALAPGTPMVYLGSFVLCCGMAFMFFRKMKRKQNNSSTTTKQGAGSIVKHSILLLVLMSTLIPIVQAIEVPKNLDYDIVRSIPILESGRYKPLGTFAGESMQEITGRWKFNKTDPMAHLLAMMISQDWYNEPLIKVNYHALKELLGYDPSQTHFSYNELVANQQFLDVVERTRRRMMKHTELTRLENELIKVYSKLELFDNIQTGEALKIVPPTGNEKEDPWLPIIKPLDYPQETQQELKTVFLHLLDAAKADDAAQFNQHGLELKNLLAGLNPELYPPIIDIEREIVYNSSRPFLKSWIFYLLSFLLFLASFYFMKSRPLYWSAMGVCLIGFSYNTWGLIFRGLIAHRAPVSNMYESVVFVGWGILLFALIYELIYRARWFGAPASLLGVCTLILADILPFDPNIEPLQPVLRSNYWLITHVLTITLSYSAFVLAMGLAHINLAIYFYMPKRKDLLDNLSLFLYRILQAGVILLAAGTLLGGVWAAESWGRFWGWDPKETWALISLLGYMAILHARFTDWIADYGTAVCSIIGFWLILMTWYGVNFILASGRHSYGFGSGGGTYIIAFMIIEIVFLVVVGIKYLMATPSISDVLSPLPPGEG